MQSTLFAPLHTLIAKLVREGFPTLKALNALLAAHQPQIIVHSGAALRFVEQGSGKLAFESQYEPRCYLNGEVQTREDNLHDLFNALVWLTYPKSKAAINARHYDALTRPATGSSERGAVRDAATLLDESGVIVVCADDELAGLLKDFQWKELFWHRRAEVQASTGFFLFGHGLYEKALHPYTGMTGQGLLLSVAQDFFGWPDSQQLAHLDQHLANYLAEPAHFCSTRELSPVPLLGVPGWSADNEDAAFYDNTAYFRSGRRAVANT